MPQSKLINRRVVLASRPHGAPLEANFRIEQSPIPEPAEGQVLLRTVYLSLDPYMRGRMSDAPSYAAPVEVGGVIVGGTVCRVEASKNPAYKVGDWVLSFAGWQDYTLSDGSDLTALGESSAHPSYALGIFGMPVSDQRNRDVMSFLQLVPEVIGHNLIVQKVLYVLFCAEGIVDCVSAVAAKGCITFHEWCRVARRSDQSVFASDEHAVIATAPYMQCLAVPGLRQVDLHIDRQSCRVKGFNLHGDTTKFWGGFSGDLDFCCEYVSSASWQADVLCCDCHGIE